MTTTTNPYPDVPAVHVEQPVSVPTSAQVKASFDPNERMASEISPLTTVTSGDTKIKVVRNDWPDSDSSVSINVSIDYSELELRELRRVDQLR
jgi:hypothetical protein